MAFGYGRALGLVDLIEGYFEGGEMEGGGWVC